MFPRRTISCSSFKPGRRLLPVLVLWLAGCGDSGHENVLREQTRNIEKLAAILSAVKDQASMTQAKEQLHELEEYTEKVARKAKSLGQPTEGQKKQLLILIESMNQAVQRVRSEMARIQGLPGGREFLEGADTLDQLGEAP